MGGISGQSSYGHLYSIDQWHSKSLPVENIKFIIYYFGVNDISLLSNIPTIKEYRAQAYANNRFWKIKSFLLKYSFFYAKIQELRNIYFSPILKETDFFGYLRKDNRFLDIGEKILLKEALYKDESNYIKLIKDLSERTTLLFPFSKIYWVQQPLPGCKFLSSNEVIERHRSEASRICTDLAEVYSHQYRALSNQKSIPKDNIIKMYLDNPLTDEGTHDNMHNNNLGATQIGNYLYEKIFNKL